MTIVDQQYLRFMAPKAVAQERYNKQGKLG